MAVLAMRLSTHQNAVSQLHAQVSRRLWRGVVPDLPLSEVPIRPITNGVHRADLDRARDRRDAASPRRPETVDREELWQAHERLRARLVAACREKLVEEKRRLGAPEEEIDEAARALDPEGPDDRLRAALRDLQARDAALPRTGATRVPAPPDRPPGADPLRRQGAPAGRGGQGVPPRGRRRPRSARSSGAASCSCPTTTWGSRARSWPGCDVWLNNPSGRARRRAPRG